MKILPSVRREQKTDIELIAELHRAAFGPEDGAIIAGLMSDLRLLAAPLPAISLVAESADGGIIGHVMLSHAWVDAPAAMVDVYTLSPLGVHPDWQKQGIGKTLIARALEAAKEAGAVCVFLEGNPKYYKSSGFMPAEQAGFRRPSTRIPQAAFQVASLSGQTNSLSGTFVYRDVFWRHDCVGLRKQVSK
jgi:putative acetyltransferase